MNEPRSRAVNQIMLTTNDVVIDIPEGINSNAEVQETCQSPANLEDRASNLKDEGCDQSGTESRKHNHTIHTCNNIDVPATEGVPDGIGQNDWPRGESRGEDSTSSDATVKDGSDCKDLDKECTSIDETNEPVTLECRICMLSEDTASFVQPCECSGSLKYAHLDCLKKWVRERRQLTCEICGAIYKEALLPELQPEVSNNPEENMAMTNRSPFFPDWPLQSPGSRQTGWRNRKLVIKVALIGLLIGVIAAVLVILGINASQHTWAAVMLRIIAFGLPTLLVLRAFIACCELRSPVRG
eukprot:jgi/Picsp_1/4958/NSC_02321-R1_ring fyve phd zinc finger-containing protein